MMDVMHMVIGPTHGTCFTCGAWLSEDDRDRLSDCVVCASKREAALKELRRLHECGS
jgi:hypothetical protein